MNIFILDLDPAKAAKYHCDSHVVKMILESAQLLSTVHHLSGTGTQWMYKQTHANHPCTKWLLQSKDNYEWCWNLGIWLCVEYTYRFNRLHATQTLLEKMERPPLSLPEPGGLTPFAQAMPDEFKDTDAVQAYRNYYRVAKAHLHKYTRCDAPAWLKII